MSVKSVCPENEHLVRHFTRLSNDRVESKAVHYALREARLREAVISFMDSEGCSRNGSREILLKLRWTSRKGKVMSALDYLRTPYNMFWNVVETDYRGVPYLIVLNQRGFRGKLPTVMETWKNCVIMCGPYCELNCDIVPDSERQALVDLYNLDQGEYWSKGHQWCSSRPVHEWRGVTVVGQHVHSLDVTIPYLRDEEVVSVMSHLPALNGLKLETKEIAYFAPSISILTNLVSLQVKGTFLNPIPAEVGQLPLLRHFVTKESQFTGPLPEELSNLTQLSHLNVSMNQLTGPLPEWLSSMTSLVHLDLAFNHFTGPIPPQLTALTNLVELKLAHNKLSGEIPFDFITCLKDSRLFLVGKPNEFSNEDDFQESCKDHNVLSLEMETRVNEPL